MRFVLFLFPAHSLLPTSPLLPSLCWCCLVTKLCLTPVTPWTVAPWAPLSLGFPRQEYWSGLPFPSPGSLPDPEIDMYLLLCRWILYRWAIWEALPALCVGFILLPYSLSLRVVGKTTSSLWKHPFSCMTQKTRALLLLHVCPEEILGKDFDGVLGWPALVPCPLLWLRCGKLAVIGSRTGIIGSE